MKNKNEENEREALAEFNLKCYFLSIYLLFATAVVFLFNPDTRFVLHHLYDWQAIIEYGRQLNH
jgi:hypothetical protein